MLLSKRSDSVYSGSVLLVMLLFSDSDHATRPSSALSQEIIIASIEANLEHLSSKISSRTCQPRPKILLSPRFTKTGTASGVVYLRKQIGVRHKRFECDWTNFAMSCSYRFDWIAYLTAARSSSLELHTRAMAMRHAAHHDKHT